MPPFTYSDAIHATNSRTEPNAHLRKRFSRCLSTVRVLIWTSRAMCLLVEPPHKSSNIRRSVLLTPVGRKCRSEVENDAGISDWQASAVVESRCNFCLMRLLWRLAVSMLI